MNLQDSKDIFYYSTLRLSTLPSYLPDKSKYQVLVIITKIMHGNNWNTWNMLPKCWKLAVKGKYLGMKYAYNLLFGLSERGFMPTFSIM